MINNLSDLINASRDFSIQEGKLDIIERGRQEFISKFPLTSIQALTIDDYCLGTSENSFCYWLEFKEILFGIGGGNASKFGIYKSKNGSYYETAGPKKIALNSVLLEEKFSALKLGIVQGLDFVKEDRIEDILTSQTRIWNMVLLKIFCIYYPNKFLTIGDPDVIIECAKNIGITGVELKSENSIFINYLCRKKLNETEAFRDWQYEKIGSFIWQTFKNSAKRDYYLIGSKYGKNADVDMFPEMLKRSVVSTGFASNVDLTEIFNENHSEIKTFLQSHQQEDNSVNALKHFLSLRSGDLVAVKGDGSPKGKDGYLSIVGIAEVTEKNGLIYEHDPNGLGHIIHVKYLNAPIFAELSLGGYGRTVHKLSNDEHIQLIFKSNLKMSYFDELRKFLAQAETEELKTSHYSKKYLGLDIKVSFGQGNQSKIPWVAFLKEPDSVQKGIYPVYLFYKEQKLLILAYGVSETNTSDRSWSITSEKTIEHYFTENNLGKPQRYGSSYVFKVYDINAGIEENSINRDLNDLIEIYKAKSVRSMPIPGEPFNYKSFQEKTEDAGLIFSPQLIQRFVASLCTKPFVICSGLSGSGKTKLAQAFVQWICESEKQYKIIPVGADWTNREPLLGYPNGLEPSSYVTPDSGALQLILEASKEENQSKPYFMILDEMNLSHVERYFADFLSIMESGDSIKLYSGTNRVDSDGNKIEQEIIWPRNLFIIGTVNIDETTYMFSPKVLDRANVIEFRITPSEMQSFFKDRKELNMKELFLDKDKSKGGAGQSMGENFFKLAEEKTITKIPEIEGDDNILNKFFSELQIVGSEFGYRSATEIELLITKLGITGLVDEQGQSLNNNTKIDIAIMQKLLPKLHGSRKKLVGPLETLAGFCLVRINGSQPDNQNKTKTLFQQFISEKRDSAKWEIKYPISFEKIERMLKNVIENGFTSYAEA